MPAYSAGPGLGLTDNTFFLAPPIELSASTDGPVLRSTNEGSGPAAAFVDSATVTALFVPFGSTGR